MPDAAADEEVELGYGAPESQVPNAGWQPAPQYSGPLPQKPELEQHEPPASPRQVIVPPHEPSSEVVIPEVVPVPVGTDAEAVEVVPITDWATADVEVASVVDSEGMMLIE